MERGPRPDVALTLDEQMPDHDSKFASRRDGRHVLAAPGPDTEEEGAQWALRAGAHNALGEPETAAECLTRANELATNDELVALVNRVVSATRDRSSLADR